MAKKTKAQGAAGLEQEFTNFLFKVETVLQEKKLTGELRDNAVFNRRYGHKAEEPVPKDPHLYVEWSTGGVSGGSCWDTGNDNNTHGYTNNEPPPELESLDAVLEAVKPDLTFLQYKRFTARLFKTDTWTVYEYYGNSTDYMVKMVRVRDLFDSLKSEGWL